MSTPAPVITEFPDPVWRDVIAAGLEGFNTGRGGPGEWRQIAAVIQDEAGAVIGGLWGVTSYGWLSIDLLFVPPEFRGIGLGAEVLGRAESEARRRGCRGAWLYTFDFQAPGFYERMGYTRFGELGNAPPGPVRYFMQKEF